MIYDLIENVGIGLTLLAALACAPFVSGGIAAFYERHFGPIEDEDDDLYA